MQEGWSYIKHTGDFLNTMKNTGSIPEDAILITADVLGLYPSIPHDASLQALKEALDKRERKNISTDTHVKMAEFILKNNVRYV